MPRTEKEFCFKTNIEREKRTDTVHLGFLMSCKIDTCLFQEN